MEALPALALHHEAITLVWRLGRLRSGDEGVRPLADLAARALALERWLGASGVEVVREGREIIHRSDDDVA